MEHKWSINGGRSLTRSGTAKLFQQLVTKNSMIVQSDTIPKLRQELRSVLPQALPAAQRWHLDLPRASSHVSASTPSRPPPARSTARAPASSAGWTTPSPDGTKEITKLSGISRQNASIQSTVR